MNRYQKAFEKGFKKRAKELALNEEQIKRAYVGAVGGNIQNGLRDIKPINPSLIGGAVGSVATPALLGGSLGAMLLPRKDDRFSTKLRNFGIGAGGGVLGTMLLQNAIRGGSLY